MKVICEKRKEIEVVKTCRKEFCCKELERAFSTFPSEHSYGGDYTSNMRVEGGIVEMIIHADYNGNYDDYEKINYCPFCGAKLTVENIEVDNTGLMPTEKVPGDWTRTIKPKKKHWWNK